MRKHSTIICLGVVYAQHHTKSLTALSSRQGETNARAVRVCKNDSAEAARRSWEERDEKTNDEQTLGGEEKIERRTCPSVHQPSVIQATDRLCRLRTVLHLLSATERSRVPRGIALIYVDTIFIRTDRWVGRSFIRARARLPAYFGTIFPFFARTDDDDDGLASPFHEKHLLFFGIKMRTGQTPYFPLTRQDAPDAPPLASPIASHVKRSSRKFLFRLWRRSDRHIVALYELYVTFSNCVISATFQYSCEIKVFTFSYEFLAFF